MLNAFQAVVASLRDPGTRAQLVPTLLNVNEEKQQVEKWRLLMIPPQTPVAQRGVWDGFCITVADGILYDGKPLTEVMFWSDNDGSTESVELTAFRLTLKRQAVDENETGRLLVQEEL